MGFFTKLVDDILGIDPPKPPPLPPLPEPDPPPPVPPTIDTSEGPDAEEIRKRRASMSGRRKTIVTGDLTPEVPGKTNLLGRPA